MKVSEFKGSFGKMYERESQEHGKHPTFVPDKLPPKFHYGEEIINALSDTDNALGRLSGAGSILPNPDLFFQLYIRKESVSSSRIEGTRISLPEFLLTETKKIKRKDIEAKEVKNYADSMKYALKKIKKEPINKNLIKRMHEILMKGIRGTELFPGSFRPVQNLIVGGNRNVRFFPPPPEEVKRLIDELIDYMEGNDETPLLIKCALMHYQFETIHPFCDGNGRIGRSLITLYLCKKGKIPGPLLDVSGYFENYKREYCDLLLETNKTGRFENWIKFFLDAIKVQSEDALERTDKILKLRERYDKRAKSYGQTNNLLKVIDMIFEIPFIKVKWIKDELKITSPTAKKIIDDLIKLKILESSGKDGREKIFVAGEIMDAIHSDPA